MPQLSAFVMVMVVAMVSQLTTIAAWRQPEWIPDGPTLDLPPLHRVERCQNPGTMINFDLFRVKVFTLWPSSSVTRFGDF